MKNGSSISRADHIGSLLRPDELIQARDAFEAGRLDRLELAALEDRCIAEAVKLQEAVGLKSITDGEFRRKNYITDFAEKLEGISISTINGHDGESYSVKMPVMRITGRVRWQRPIMISDLAFLKGRTAQTPKMTIPAPTQIHFFAGREGIDEQVYPDLEEFWADVILAYRTEIKALADAGLTFLQIDETCLPKLCDISVRSNLKARGQDPQALIERYVWALNEIVKDPPPDLLIGMHQCRGNFAGGWGAEGSYEAIADAIFNQIDLPVTFLNMTRRGQVILRPCGLYPHTSILCSDSYQRKNGLWNSRTISCAGLRRRRGSCQSIGSRSALNVDFPVFIRGIR